MAAFPRSLGERNKQHKFASQAKASALQGISGLICAMALERFLSWFVPVTTLGISIDKNLLLHAYWPATTKEWQQQHSLFQKQGKATDENKVRARKHADRKLLC